MDSRFFRRLVDIYIDTLFGNLLYSNSLKDSAPVAQLDRASVYGTEGWGFESLQA
jgi:hypothetical protein